MWAEWINLEVSRQQVAVLGLDLVDRLGKEWG